MYYKILVIASFAFLICAVSAADTIANSTKLTTTTPAPSTNEDPLKKELRKFLKDCGGTGSGEVEVASGEETDDPDTGPQLAKMRKENFGFDDDNKRKKNKGTYPNVYGNKRKNKDYDDEDEDDDEDFNQRRGGGKGGKGKNKKNNRNNNRRGGGGRGGNDYDDSEEEGCMNKNNRRGGGGGGGGGNRNNNRNRGGGGGGGGGGNRGRGGGPSHGNNRYGGEDFGMYDNWGGGDRSKRAASTNEDQPTDENENENQPSSSDDETTKCLSQCVFNFMELLDDNKLPSETEFINYYQNKITNNVLKIKTIRSARRCFAKFAVKDDGDGCDFSKNIAKCLKLNIDE